MDRIKQLLPSKEKFAEQYQDLLITNNYDCTYVDYDAKPSNQLIQKYVDEYGINTNCHDACIVCQITHIEKYKGSDKLERGENPFKVDCDFIPKTYDPPADIAAELTQEEIDLYRAWSDPVEWAYKFLGWKARPHQKIMLRCTGKRVVERCGRRSGKCLVKGTQIATPKGPVGIEDLKPGDLVYDENGNPIRVKRLFDQGVQEVVDLTSHNRILATCTENHRWLTTTKYAKDRVLPAEVKRVVDFQKYDLINRIEVEAPLGDVDEPLAYVLGVLGGDGCCREEGLVISNQNESVVRQVAKLLNTTYVKHKEKNYSWYLPQKNKQCIPYYYDWLDKKYAHEKLVDLSVVKSWNRSSLLSFVAGLLDTDGSVYFSGKEISIRLSMQARPYVEAFQYALLALWGINRQIYIDDRDKYANGPCYYISIKHIYNCKRILKELSPFLQVKSKRYREKYDVVSPNNFTPIGYGVKKKNRRFEQCYDIEVDSPNHLFLLANGMVSHNSEVNVVRALFRAFTISKENGEMADGTKLYRGPKLMVITPFLSQITEFFDKANDLLKRNQMLWDESHQPRGRFVKTPYQRMEMSNGAEIAGLTTGSSSTNDASTLRGLGANDLYFDETDFMKEGDFKAVLPILHENKDQTARASSTPKGSRSKYYDWCMNSPDWKEFYFPSTVLENWAEVEDSVKAEHTQAEIMQEYMCAFLAEDVGVYQPQYVNYAFTSPQYYYGDLGYNPEFIYSIGVDWNSNVGTEIVISALDPNNNDIWVVECINIPKQGWTQLAGIEAIVNANRRWKPNFIYVDSGGSGGETSYELLRAYGKQQRGKGGNFLDAKLFDIVTSYDFGSKIEVRSPADGSIQKKYAKDFMVQSSVRLFEQGRIHIPTDEKYLKQQLLNYIIKRTNPSGQKVYDVNSPRIGDHRLDAFNLSVVAFKLEMSDFSVHGPNVVTTVLYAGAPGERYAERISKQSIPGLVTIDARYPEGYMQYNIDGLLRKNHKPINRTESMGEKETGLIKPGKPIYPGSKMMELKPGFTNDTEKLEKRKFKKQRQRRRNPRTPSFRRNI